MTPERSPVVITGASRGIGAAMARHFVAEGRFVIGVDLGGVAPELARVEAYVHEVADITDETALDRALQAGWLRGPVGAVFANAGVTDVEHRRVADLPYAIWRKVLQINLDGAFLTAQLAARRMVEQGFGNIVFITSSLAKLDQAHAGDAPYCTSKAAVEMFSKVLSLEVATAGVNVNTLFPSVKVDTGFFAHLPTEERLRLARPDILNRAASFLAGLPPRRLTGNSVDQDRFDHDERYRRSLGAAS